MNITYIVYCLKENIIKIFVNEIMGSYFLLYFFLNFPNSFAAAFLNFTFIKKYHFKKMSSKKKHMLFLAPIA